MDDLISRQRNMKYRKKPVVIEAYQTDKELDIETLEGTMHASVGDYIITGVRGEQYPCKPDIFEQTYEPAAQAERKKGKWIDAWRSAMDGTKHWHRECSECGYERDDDDPDKDTKFCPNCGLPMETEVGE